MSMSRLWQKTLWRTSLRLSSSVSCFCEKVGLLTYPFEAKKISLAPFDQNTLWKGFHFREKEFKSSFCTQCGFNACKIHTYVFRSTFDETFFRSFRRGFLPWDVCFEKPQTQQNVPADIHWFWYIQSLRRKCSVKELRTIKQWKTATFTMGHL